MKRVFVTGANSLLGTNLIIKLLSEGFHVTGLLRDISKFKASRDHENLVLIEGGLFDNLSNTLADIDYIVHIAAVTAQDLLKYENYYNINVNSTIKLFNESSNSGVKRFIYISSANTIGYGTIENPGDENNMPKKPFIDSYYAKSKIEAEHYLLTREFGSEIIILNPTFILGNYITNEGSGRLIKLGYNKRVLFYPPGGKNIVHVNDVARSIISSFTATSVGERHLIANENLTYKQFYLKMNKITSQNPLMIRIPTSILFLIGLIGDSLRKFGVKNSLSMVNMKILCVKNFYTNKKSIELLGMSYHSVDEAIKDSVYSIFHEGKCNIKCMNHP